MDQMKFEKKFDTWKHGLLDLSKRNRMINYRKTKRTTLALNSPGFSELFRRLVEKEETIPFKMRVDTSREPQTEQLFYLMKQLGHPMEFTVGEICTDQTYEETALVLKNLRAKAKLSLEEQGVNILYLAFGFLEWRQKPGDALMPAPLVLVPVSLTVESFGKPYTIKKMDEDIVVNPTLAYALSSDFHIELPEFDAAKMQLDDYMETVQTLVEPVGWRVVREANLGLLSFLKIVIYRDLEKHKDRVEENPVIRAFCDDPTLLPEWDPEADRFCHDDQRALDGYEVVNADSSQQRAILLSKRGQSFLLQGPPGTGKSQTITNIIAEGLAQGKKILFVSEKMAALSVVYRRLEEVGLADYCLSLHNYKADKKEVVAGLARSLDAVDIEMDPRAQDFVQDFEAERDELNAYFSVLKTVRQPFGRSMYDVLTELCELEEVPLWQPEKTAAGKPENGPWDKYIGDGTGELYGSRQGDGKISGKGSRKMSGELRDLRSVTSVTAIEYRRNLQCLMRLEEFLRDYDGDIRDNPWRNTNITMMTFDQQRVIRQTLDDLDQQLQRPLDILVELRNNCGMEGDVTWPGFCALTRKVAEAKQLSDEANRTEEYYRGVLDLPENGEETVRNILEEAEGLEAGLLGKADACSHRDGCDAGSHRDGYDACSLRDGDTRSAAKEKLRAEISALRQAGEFIEEYNARFATADGFGKEDLKKQTDYLNAIWEADIVKASWLNGENRDYYTDLAIAQQMWVLADAVRVSAASKVPDETLSRIREKYEACREALPALRKAYGEALKNYIDLCHGKTVAGGGAEEERDGESPGAGNNSSGKNPRAWDLEIDPDEEILEKNMKAIRREQNAYVTEQKEIDRRKKALRELDFDGVDAAGIVELLKRTMPEKPGTTGACCEKLRRRTDDLEVLATRLNMQKNLLLQDWREEFLSFDGRPMLERFALRYTSPFKALNSQYRADRRTLRLMRENITENLPDDGVCVEALKRLGTYQSVEKQFQGKLREIRVFLADYEEELEGAISGAEERAAAVRTLADAMNALKEFHSGMDFAGVSADEKSFPNGETRLSDINRFFDRMEDLRRNLKRYADALPQAAELPHFHGEDTDWDEVLVTVRRAEPLVKYAEAVPLTAEQTTFALLPPAERADTPIGGKAFSEWVSPGENGGAAETNFGADGKAGETNHGVDGKAGERRIWTYRAIAKHPSNSNGEQDGKNPETRSEAERRNSNVGVAWIGLNSFSELFDDEKKNVHELKTERENILRDIETLEGVYDRIASLFLQAESHTDAVENISFLEEYLEKTESLTARKEETDRAFDVWGLPDFFLQSGNIFEMFLPYIEQPQISVTFPEQEALNRFASWFTGDILSEETVLSLAVRCALCSDLEKLNSEQKYMAICDSCIERHLGEYLDYVTYKNMSPEEILPVYRKSFLTEWMLAWANRGELKEFRQFESWSHENLIRRFRKDDQRLLKLNRLRLSAMLSARKPEGRILSRSGRDEAALLRHEAGKKRKIMPLRRLFAEIPELLQMLKPCFMMSPLSVSYFLESDFYQFDLVLFDEASQILPEDAIGAIYRGKQVILAGDTKQMPPTSFFTATISNDDTYDSDDDDAWEDVVSESILDEADRALNPCTLLWHYRSKDESLIAFSNRELYDNRLTTFPNCEKVPDKGLEYIYLKDGVYEGGGKNRNLLEANTCAALVLAHIKQHPERSLGIIAFSEKQQTVIENAVQQMRLDHPQYEDFFDEDREEPFFIKNLENVQGDERDTIIFSICYGRNKAGKMYMNFGPLGKDGGERRLNVAITRAKYNVKLVGSILPQDFSLREGGSLGVRLLRDYIVYAMENDYGLPEGHETTERDRFPNVIAAFLTAQGYEVRRNVGASRYQVDIAVFCPGRTDRYIAGIECDGDNYTAAKTARDRDYLRRDIMESVGWNMYHVWSLAWYRNPGKEKKRLLDFLRKAEEGSAEQAV